MITGLLLLQLITFSFTLWFGLYLLLRDSTKPGLRFAGLGLVTYAFGLALSALESYFPFITPGLTQWRIAPVLLPSVFWMAATWSLYPEATPLARPNASIGVPLATVAVLLVLFVAFSPAIGQAVVIVVPFVFLLIALAKIRLAWQSPLPRSPLITLVIATLFFLLGTGLLVLPVQWLSNKWVLLAISFDMVLLGAVLGAVDAYEEGTSLLPDALRSFFASSLAVVLLGGQVIAILFLVEVTSPLILILVFSVIATAIGLETFSGKLLTVLDRIVFADRPQIYQERTMLRSINEALPRTKSIPTWQLLDDETFARLTRRALSHYNDLDKLASSPLAQMPLVTQRLRQHNKGDTMLERTHELKQLLTEAILYLKPYSDHNFGTSDAWRYYNVLYFPYVLGLKPYSVRMSYDDLEAVSRTALEWFQTHVPERTLYNWQTTAARLVANHLKEIQTEVLSTKT